MRKKNKKVSRKKGREPKTIKKKKAQAKAPGERAQQPAKKRSRRFLETEEIYKVLVESSPNLVLIIQEGKTVYANPAVERLTGVSADKLLVNPEQLIKSFIAPEYRKLVRNNLASRLRGEDVGEYEIELIDRDKNRRNIIVKSQIITYQNKLADMVLLVDITDHRRMEERLRLLYQAIDQSLDGIAVADLKGYLLFANQAWAEMHQMDIRDIIGRHLSIFHSPEQLAREVKPFNEVVIEKGALQGEIGHRRADGTEFRTWMSTTLMKDEHGRPIGMIGVARDITERKEMEDQTIRSERLAMAGLIASGIAHEINNPLTAIYASAQMLVKELNNNAPVSSLDRIDKILTGSERIRELIRNFLDFARPAAQINKIKLDINDVLLESLMMTSHLRKKGTDVKTMLGSDLPQVVADPGQLVTVFTNLLINAHQALEGKGGRIEIETTMRGKEWVEVIVRDNGEGIPTEIADRIFDPFFTTKSGEKGTGLGLAIVQSIISSMEGNISFRSKQGSMTEFFIRIPVWRKQH